MSGLRHTLGAPDTRATLIRSDGYAFCASIYFSLLPLVARNKVGGDTGIYGLLLGCLGVGGIAAVVLLPRWRGRLSADRIARTGSFASALLLAALAACHALWSTIPVLLAAGVAWVAVVATVNVAAQMTLPAWVRARGLSIFVIVLNGMMALGSMTWGLAAAAVRIPGAFVVSAVCLLAFDLLTMQWRIPGMTCSPRSRSASRPAKVSKGESRDALSRSGGAEHLLREHVAHGVEVEPMCGDQVGGVGDDCIDVADQAQLLIKVGDLDPHALANQLHKVDQLE